MKFHQRASLSVVIAFSALVGSTGATAQTTGNYEVEDFIRKQKFEQIKLSPTGEYYAATVPVEQRKTSLAIIRRSDNKLMANMGIPGDRTHVAGFWWVNDERVVLSSAIKMGAHEAPFPTGDLYAVNANGGQGEILVGQSVRSEGPASNIQRKKVETVAAYLVDDLPGNDKEVIISVRPFTPDAYARLERMDVYTGRRRPIATAPVRNTDFLTDNAGNVRFAIGRDVDRTTRLYYRGADSAEWTLINDSRQTGLSQWPLGFSTDDKTVYLQVEHPQGPDSVVAWEIAADKRSEVLRDDNTDPEPIYVGNVLYGMRLMDGLPRTVFFDEQSKIAKLYRKLEKAFGGQRVVITSITKDGGAALVYAGSDRNPGDYYVFDTIKNKAEHLLASSEWIDPDRAGATRAISFKTRDGLQIQGYLTSPAGVEAKSAPLIVLMHGGPFKIYDTWGYEPEVQMLAAHGYAVLQVNFRGSGNHGLAFEQAGRREWGGKMQDDITDATRWAIQQGIADPKRICLYGASYGAYASLMGVVKEPDLYACAAGYVGVYDLPTMHTDGDIQQSKSGDRYVEDWIGPKEEVAKVSPNRLASRIKVPVFLAAGGEDERAPIQHTEMMEKALRKAGVPVEAVYYPTEGHGFYKIENERDYYSKLLTFFSRHLGGRMPVIVASSAKK
jgi:dipeptidyl aminopeptidase/acylaminoacyl peptidase